MLKHASNANGAAPVNGQQLLRTTNGTNAGSATNNSSGHATTIIPTTATTTTTSTSNSNNNNNSSNNNSNHNNNAPPVTGNNSNSNIINNNNNNVAMAGVVTVAAAAAPPPPPPPNASATSTPTLNNAGGPAAAAVANTARNIHLRPPQPLNISSLLQTSTASNTCGGTLLNGGGRVANGTLLNIVAPPPPPVTPGTPVKQLTPLTPLTPNGNLNLNHHHHHTYTNQHMLASSIREPYQNPNFYLQSHTTGAAAAAASVHHQQQQQQQQQQQHHHIHATAHTHPIHPTHPYASQYMSNNNNNNMSMSMSMNNLNNNNNNNNINAHNYSNCNNLTAPQLNIMQPIKSNKHGPGPREALTSLGLLCLVSLLFALLSLIFLLKISPNSRDDAMQRNLNSEDFIIVYDVTLALCALSLSLNLCCLLVCAIQFLFAVKLVRSPMFDGRDNKYLEKSSASRTCAVSGFFISIPVFLTGIILYTFNHYHSTPAIITSVLIGVGIVFCGGAMVHNVFVWQKEKTISYRSVPMPLNMSIVSAGTMCQPPQPPPPPPTLSSSSSSAVAAAAPNHMQLLTTTGYAPPQLPPQSTTMTLMGQQQQHQQPLQLYAQHTNHYLSAPSHVILQQQPNSLTPVSPNHSHGSFNPLLCAAAPGGNNGANSNSNGGTVNSSFLVRPATATPPTPKPSIGNGGVCLLGMGAGGGGREASGSVSPAAAAATLDMSNITNISLHELSTLV